MTDHANPDIVETLIADAKCGPNDGLPSMLDLIVADCGRAAAEITKLRDERNTYLAELMNIGNAKRFDRQFFDDDSSFADWAQNRARQHYQAIARAKSGAAE